MTNLFSYCETKDIKVLGQYDSNASGMLIMHTHDLSKGNREYINYIPVKELVLLKKDSTTFCLRLYCNPHALNNEFVYVLVKNINEVDWSEQVFITGIIGFSPESLSRKVMSYILDWTFLYQNTGIHEQISFLLNKDFDDYTFATIE